MGTPNAKLVSVQVGAVAAFGPAGRHRSAFLKRFVNGRVEVTTAGLRGDEQADRRVHGGPEKAVYCYPAEHYHEWADAYPEHTVLLQLGGFGENLTTLGLTEPTVMIGDTLRVGTAVLQVTQPRQPCFKLALRFSDGRLGRTMTASGMSGWYLRVLEPGWLTAEDEVQVVERPHPSWPVRRAADLLSIRRGTAAEYAELAGLSGAGLDLRAQARKRGIARGSAEPSVD